MVDKKTAGQGAFYLATLMSKLSSKTFALGLSVLTKTAVKQVLGA